MFRWIFIATVVIGLGAASARADLEPGTFAPDIEAKEWLNSPEPVSLRDARGMVVVLFFWVSFHGGGQDMMLLINMVENNPSLGRERGVMVIGLTDADRKRTEDVVRGEKLFFPVGVESKSHEEYRISSFPRVVVIDAEGKVSWSGWPAEDEGAQLRDAILAALEKTPPTRTHPTQAAKVNASLEKARAALREKRYRDAFEAARSAYEKALTGDPLKAACREMVDLVEAIARDQLASGEKAMQAGDFSKGVQFLRGVIRNFRGTDAAKAAQEKLDEAKKQHDQVAEILKNQEGDAKARGNLKKAREHIEARRFGPGYELLQQIIKDSADSEVASSAEEIVERMRKNEDVMREVRDYLAKRDCEAWLGQARSFIRSNRKDKARELLRKIIETYPDTRYSDEAYRELITIP